MSDFKFACPVCGQHITASSDSSGEQIECPTCFQKIVVPQARSADSKLILNAAQANKPRPALPSGLDGTVPKPHRSSSVAGVVFLLALLLAGAGTYAFRERLGLVKRLEPVVVAPTNPPLASASLSNQPVPDVKWTLDPAAAAIPNKPAAGSLRGQSFQMTRALLQGGTLTLRHGKGSPPDLSVSVMFPAKRGEDLGGKDVKVSAEQPPPLPKVVLRWKNDAGKTSSKSFNSGYSLQVKFGDAAGGRITGSIYLALPDDQRSGIAGTFDAEIRAAAVPKKKTAPASKNPP